MAWLCSFGVITGVGATAAFHGALKTGPWCMETRERYVLMSFPSCLELSYAQRNRNGAPTLWVRSQRLFLLSYLLARFPGQYWGSPTLTRGPDIYDTFHRNLLPSRRTALP